MISVVDYNLPYDTHNLYDVTFHSHTIHTLLTSSPSQVNDWISNILRQNRHNRRNRPRNNLVVGLDIEWRPNTNPNSQNPVATLQLCVGLSCLVFQILHSPYIPQSLVDFLSSADHTFVGVGIRGDVEKLLEDYSLRVENCEDLRRLAEDVLGERDMRGAGLRTLARRVLGTELEKPERITRSRWDNEWLTAEQVQYACVDAFVSFEVGRRLFVRSGDGYGF